jgi:hypothetical protein
MKNSRWILLIFLLTWPAAGADSVSSKKHVEHGLDALTHKIDDFRNRSEQAGVRTREKLNHELPPLQRKAVTVRQKLDAFRDGGERHLKSLRRGIEQAMDNLRHAWEKTTARLHQ